MTDFSKPTRYKIGWALIAEERRVAISTSKTLLERSSECSDSFFETKSRTAFMLSFDRPQLDSSRVSSVFLLLSSSGRIVSSKYEPGGRKKFAILDVDDGTSWSDEVGVVDGVACHPHTYLMDSRSPFVLMVDAK